MKLSKIALGMMLASSVALSACSNPESNQTSEQAQAAANQGPLLSGFENRLDIYKEVTLSAPIGHLTDNQKQMLSVLIDASKIMDDLNLTTPLNQRTEIE